MSNNGMRHLFIEPLDVWLFRNGRPFNREEDHTAQGTFPPLPGTMQGILRSHHLALHKVNVHNRTAVANHVGARHTYPDNFQVTGPFIARRQNGGVTRYFPLPKDLYLDEEREVYRAFKPDYRPDTYTDLMQQKELAHLHLLYRHEKREPKKDDSEGGRWIAETELDAYLRDQEIPHNKIIAGSELFTTETRVGIGLNSQRRVAEEGQLYEVKFTRLKDNVGLTVSVAGLDGWPDKGVIAVGGEARAGRYQSCAGWSPSHRLADAADRFKIVFLTPAYFANGWRSENWGQFFAGNAQLVTAVAGRPLIWGGRDLAENRHEPSYRYVPAGSVYYFKGQVKLKLPYITDNPDQFGPTGFGQFTIGGWK